MKFATCIGDSVGDTDRPQGFVQKGRATLSLGVFLLAGIGFTIAFGAMFYVAAAAHFWNATDCQIRKSEILEDRAKSNPYWFVVEYEYAVGGRQYASQTYRRDYCRSDLHRDTMRLVKKYPVGSRKKKMRPDGTPAEPISVAAIGGRAVWLLHGFFAIFFLMGFPFSPFTASSIAQ